MGLGFTRTRCVFLADRTAAEGGGHRGNARPSWASVGARAKNPRATLSAPSFRPAALVLVTQTELRAKWNLLAVARTMRMAIQRVVLLAVMLPQSFILYPGLLEAAWSDRSLDLRDLLSDTAESRLVGLSIK